MKNRFNTYDIMCMVTELQRYSNVFIYVSNLLHVLSKYDNSYDKNQLNNFL